MTWLDTVRSTVADLAQKAVEVVRPAPLDYAEATLAAMSEATSFARLLVRPDVAFRVSVVLAASRVIAEGLAQVPLGLFRDTGKKRVPAEDHDVFPLLSVKPNDWQTPFDWVETMTLHAVLAGAGYSYKNRVKGKIVELIPMMPQCMSVTQDADTQELTYHFRKEDGSTIPFKPEDIFCIRGPSWDGFTGLQLVRLAAQAIGLAAYSEETQTRLHRNGTRLSGFLTSDQKIQKDEIEALKLNWQIQYAGSQSSFKVPVLHSGMKFISTQMTGVDAQHLETRKFQVEEICRFMRVFPQMVMSSSGHALGSSVEQFFISHIVHCIQPWATRWEQTIKRDLLTPADLAAGVYPRFNLMELLRGDMVARAGFYSRGILDGWLTRNEARASENMDPIAGLDLPLRPLNMGDGTKAPSAAPPPPPRGTGDGNRDPAGPGGSPGNDQTLQPGSNPPKAEGDAHAG